ncbi:MAG: hypothetical protein LBC89_03580 [Bacteroidales bacterium]|nr:hypothetical protein [Bacteroidales bacterium]
MRITEEENNRLEQIQRKFGIKTNSEAVRMLLKYTVILDDELQTFHDNYEELAKIAFLLKDLFDKLYFINLQIFP